MALLNREVVERILDNPEVAKLVTLVEEAARSTEEGVKRFVEPAQGTLSRAVNKPDIIKTKNAREGF
jgi:hypothetical protein